MAKTSQNLALGHRKRLRDRLVKAGPEALADYEVLELVLYQGLPRGDTKPLAKSLLKRFGDFSSVLHAEPLALQGVPGVGEATVASLKIAQAIVSLALRNRIQSRPQPVLGASLEVVEYCKGVIAYAPTEQLWIFYLDQKNTLLLEELQQTGTLDHTPIYPREIIKRAIEIGAAAIILVHNHPSGDPTPSPMDISMTHQVQEAAATFGITLHDHLILARDCYVSLREEGLL